MNRRRKHSHKALWAIAAIMAIAAAVIIINGFTHDDIDDMAWEKSRQPEQQHIETDTIMPGAIIDSDGISGMVLIGEETATAVKRLSTHFDIDSIITDDTPTGRNYTLSKDGEIQIILQNSSHRRISAIFILAGDYFTERGIGVGSTFASVFSAYPDAEMRLGEAEDGINGSSELCKATDGMLFLKWLDETASPKIASYTDEGIMTSLTDNYALYRIDEIIITPNTWRE